MTPRAISWMALRSRSRRRSAALRGTTRSTSSARHVITMRGTANMTFCGKRERGTAIDHRCRRGRLRHRAHHGLLGGQDHGRDTVTSRRETPRSGAHPAVDPDGPRAPLAGRHADAGLLGQQRDHGPNVRVPRERLGQSPTRSGSVRLAEGCPASPAPVIGRRDRAPGSLVQVTVSPSTVDRGRRASVIVVGDVYRRLQAQRAARGDPGHVALGAWMPRAARRWTASSGRPCSFLAR